MCVLCIVSVFIVLYLVLVLPLPPPPPSFAARPCHVAMAIMPVGSIPGAVMLQYCTFFRDTFVWCAVLDTQCTVVKSDQTHVHHPWFCLDAVSDDATSI